MPEERNRVEVDRLAQLLFCPDERSLQTLANEGVGGEALVVGDVMADAARLFAPLARGRSRRSSTFSLEPGKFVLATVHREANVVAAPARPHCGGLERDQRTRHFFRLTRVRAARSLARN